jgi:hypothetical protein
MKKPFHRSMIFLSLWLLKTNCSLEVPTSTTMGTAGKEASQIQKKDQQSERQFRDLFAFHLREGSRAPNKDGTINQSMLLTPPDLLDPKRAKGFPSTLKQLDQQFAKATPEELFHYTQCQSVDHQVKPKFGSGPVTIIVFPGFTGEFIPVDPFEEIIADKKSLFAQRATPILDAISDEVYRVGEQKSVPVKLSEVIRVGSYDRNQLAWVNVIMMTSKLGSLESIGKLDASLDIYRRRLSKVFQSIPKLGKVYILGYSRGSIVGLEFLRYMSTQEKEYPWINRIEGLIGLGGVFYGSQAADDAMLGHASHSGRTALALQGLMQDLVDQSPAGSGLNDQLTLVSIVKKNMAVWAKALAEISRIATQKSKVKPNPFLEEEKLRHLDHRPDAPGIIANFQTIRPLLFELLSMQCPLKCYFQNIRAFKQILRAFLDGLQDLTTAARLEWWANRKLPARFRILSLAATMPGPVKNNQLSPLLLFPNFGYKSPDFTGNQRPSYYDLLQLGAGPLNDAAMTVVRARYWPQLDLVGGRRHDYLGILLGHHYGIGFPVAIAGKSNVSNPFPRAELIAAIASYLKENP